MLSTIIFSSLLAATAQAAAILPRADPIVWKNPSAKNGNIQVRFGDGRTSVGACTPEKIIKTLYDNCYDEGFCNSNSWTIQCQKDDLATHTITISTPEGQYQPWIKNGLVEALVAAVNTKDVVQTKTVTGQSGGGCVGCPWRSQSVKMHYMPSSIGISHLNDKQVPDVITLSIKSDSGGAAGVCEILTGAGGAMAGAFNGVAGGIFSLASLACKAI